MIIFFWRQVSPCSSGCSGALYIRCTHVYLEFKVEQCSREPPSSELGRAPWAEHKTSLMAFAHLPHAWREPQSPRPNMALPHHPSSSLWAELSTSPRPPMRLLGRGSQVCTKSPLSGLETIVLPCMETRVGSYNQAFRGWIKGQSVPLGVSGLWSCPRELLTACHPSLILEPFLRGLNPCEPWGARKLGETGSFPLLALRAQVTAPASRALGVNVQRGTTW